MSNIVQEKVKKMTVRDLVEKTNVTYNQVEIHQKGEVIFDDYSERIPETMKGLEVNQYEPFKAEWSAPYPFNLCVWVK